MTMKPWLARALRRALGTAALLLAAESLLHRTFYARPELPAADADRVVVYKPGGSSYEIRDPATVARAVAFARAPRVGWARLSPLVELPEHTAVEFYRGSDKRGMIFWSPRSLVARTRDATAAYYITRSEQAEARRLFP